MERFSNTDLREIPIADLTGHHEGGYSSDFRFKGQSDQIHHQPGMFLVIIRNADRSCGKVQVRTMLLLRKLNAAFDLTNILEIFRHSVSIGGPELFLEPG